MTEKTLASPKPSEITIANNFKKVFRQYEWYPQWNGGVNHSVQFY